jgi:hypothetical protein
VAAYGRPIHANVVPVGLHHARDFEHGRGIQRVSACG